MNLIWIQGQAHTTSVSILTSEETLIEGKRCLNIFLLVAETLTE